MPDATLRIILNADDFGMSDETTDATIACFRAGALTSATIMAQMPVAARAAAFARDNPRFSFGAHLVWVGDGVERPLSRPQDIPSLVTPEGLLLNSQHARLLAIRRRLNERDIEREAEAQLAFLRDHNIPLSHVDSHGHMHKFAQFRAALTRVLPRFGITRVRSVQNVYLRRPLKSPNYWCGKLWLRQIQSAFDTTQHLYLPRSAEEETWAERLLARRLTGVLEIGLHPGVVEPWRASEMRGAEQLASIARRRSIPLITWRDIAARRG